MCPVGLQAYRYSGTEHFSKTESYHMDAANRMRDHWVKIGVAVGAGLGLAAGVALLGGSGIGVGVAVGGGLGAAAAAVADRRLPKAA